MTSLGKINVIVSLVANPDSAILRSTYREWPKGFMGVMGFVALLFDMSIKLPAPQFQ